MMARQGVAWPGGAGHVHGTREVDMAGCGVRLCVSEPIVFSDADLPTVEPVRRQPIKYRPVAIDTIHPSDIFRTREPVGGRVRVVMPEIGRLQ